MKSVASQTKPVICIMGATATGKTALAVELAKAVKGEVISVDSALIYKDMNIGTAKPDAEEMQGIKHHLIDICTPEQSYSVAQFKQDAVACIDEILQRDKLPILAGGTMMYFNALHRGLSNIPNANPEVRQEVQALIAKQGLEYVHKQLQKVDAVSANKIHPNDPQRLTRALEVYLSTNKPLSDWQKEKAPPLPYDFRNFALVPENRAQLHERIALRFELMLQQGLVDEVKSILKKYSVNPDLPSMRSVGYRQVLEYLAGAYDQTSMIEKGIAATRQLAKRQITWLRGWENTIFLDINQDDSLQRILRTLE
jgi:tRNA dimethylallyltransferase